MYTEKTRTTRLGFFLSLLIANLRSSRSLNNRVISFPCHPTTFSVVLLFSFHTHTHTHGNEQRARVREIVLVNCGFRRATFVCAYVT